MCVHVAHGTHCGQLYESALALCIPSENEDWDQGLSATIAGLHVNLAICSSKMGDWLGVLQVRIAACFLGSKRQRMINLIQFRWVLLGLLFCVEVRSDEREGAVLEGEVPHLEFCI